MSRTLSSVVRRRGMAVSAGNDAGRSPSRSHRERAARRFAEIHGGAVSRASRRLGFPMRARLLTPPARELSGLRPGPGRIRRGS